MGMSLHTCEFCKEPITQYDMVYYYDEESDSDDEKIEEKIKNDSDFTEEDKENCRKVRKISDGSGMTWCGCGNIEDPYDNVEVKREWYEELKETKKKYDKLKKKYENLKQKLA